MIRLGTTLIVGVLLSCLLIACASRPESLTEDDIRRLFEDLRCETESLVISHRPMAEHEHLEMVFLQDSNRVHIHKSYTAPAGASTYNYQLMYTKDGVYDTRDMRYYPYETPLESNTMVFSVAQEALSFFEIAFLDCELLLERVLELEAVTRKSQGGNILLEGRIPGSMVNDIESVYQILIDHDVVVEIQRIKRYDTPASKKEDHVITSTRVNRNILEPPTFPSFDQFQDVE